jgi:hypothetical protein
VRYSRFLVRAGVFVVGMHRSGTSAATRLISFLGLHAPDGADLVPPSAKNPTGYWESMSLVAFNERVLAAVGSDMQFPRLLGVGWEQDPRLDTLRGEASEALRLAFPVAPWVWKDPRNCLVLPFWQAAVGLDPAVVVVNRNPLEIAASATRARGNPTAYTLALWERYLRTALQSISGMSVLVTDYGRLLRDPVAWCEEVRAFLERADLRVRAPRQNEVQEFVDSGLRHAEFTREDALRDPALSVEQRELYACLERLEGAHECFGAPSLPAETGSTERLLAQQRRASRPRRDPAGAVARRVHASVRRLKPLLALSSAP